MSVSMNQGVNFYNPTVSKPANLQNSAVLRMLEEEEHRQRNGQPSSLKRVAWPPPSEDSEEHSAVQEQISQPNLYKPQTTQAFKPLSAEPPPATITLRPQAPVSQAPPPVYSSQPATATLKGGKHLRGDLKWPPENVKSQMEEENRKRIELAKGPAFRPRKVQKDYSSFFAQHALNSTYPGYKAPPGTQFYDPITNY